MLFDNIADPYQLNNLAGKPEHRVLQNKLNALLLKKLKEAGDADFKPRQYYIAKWGYHLNEGSIIPYTTLLGKENIVQTPKKATDFGE